MKKNLRSVLRSRLSAHAGLQLLESLRTSMGESGGQHGRFRDWLPPAGYQENQSWGQSSLHYSPPGWVPVLKTGAWSLPTAINLAAFASLAYQAPEGKLSAGAVLEALRNGKPPPPSSAHMVLCPAEPEQLLLAPYHESRLGVQLFLTSNTQNAVLFIQGTARLRAILLDTARSQLSGMHGPNPLKEYQSLLEPLIAQTPEWITSEKVTDFLAHKSAVLDYLLSPANRGAHAGFMLLLGMFLHSPSFRNALDEHSVYEKHLFATGHSLGGALALLLARELQKDCRYRIQLYTFGCPRVGSAHFVRTIPRRILHYRVVNGGDPVARMARGRQWADHGMLRTLCAGNPPEVKTGPGPDRERLSDHFLRNYLSRLQDIWLSTVPMANQQKPHGEE